MDYLKINGKRYNLTGDEMICDGGRLYLYISASDITIPEIKKELSNQKEFIVYGCVVNEIPITDENGQPTEETKTVETDEYIATTFENFRRIVAINYNLLNDVYEIIFVMPSDMETRMYDVESSVQLLNEAKPALISAFTENAEPTGVASRYYEKDELIAIYDENDQPITVKAIQPISYKHPLIIGLNCEKYYGGNE